MQRPILLIHGGANLRIPTATESAKIFASLEKTALEVHQFLVKKQNALEAVCEAVRRLEDDPLFNAGLGSEIQSDGNIRMSAGLMDGQKLKFSGVVNIQNLK